MTPLVDIGAQLISARLARGLSQRELAELVGVHQQQIARWEKERYLCVSLGRLSRVADALGVSVGEQPLLAAEASAAYGSAVLDRPTEVVVPVRDLGEVIARIRAHADELHERFGVTSIDVFGSFARGEQTPESDVDLIVEVAEPTLETVFGSQERLTEILGRKADAGSFTTLRPRVQPYVSRERVGVWRA
ncbi:MAG: helix-turn-helix domain-containing protein [Coriobacteriia bacterium]|nr:helix-turn-helix domain-containing protein [Coriobacteriia bacterium]